MPKPENSTEKVRLWRERLRTDPKKVAEYNAVKEKDRLRKVRKRKEEAEKRKVDVSLRDSFRQENRRRKQEQRKAKRLAEMKKKNKSSNLRRRRTVYVKNKKINVLEGRLLTLRGSRLQRSPPTSPKPSTSQASNLHNSVVINGSETPPMTDDQNEASVVSTLWNAISPKSKNTIKRKLAADSEKSQGLNSKFRAFGINLSNISPSSCRTPTSTIAREKRMAEFFERDDVSRICPDKKKCMATSDGVKQIRYLTEDLKTLHMRYCAEVEDCDYSTFTRYVPPHIMKPQLSDWGTCLCMQCLNPSLKHERQCTHAQ